MATPIPIPRSNRRSKPMVPELAEKTGIRMPWTANQVRKDSNKMDRLRLILWSSARMDGKTALQAWTDIATDPDVGLHRWRGETAIPKGKLLRSLTSFLERAAPAIVAEAVRDARVEAAALSVKAVHTLRDVMQGDFEDYKNATVQVKAAAHLLDVVGAGSMNQGGGHGGRGPMVAVQINTPHEVAARLSSDPATQRAAIDLARKVSSGSDEQGE